MTFGGPVQPKLFYKSTIPLFLPSFFGRLCTLQHGFQTWVSADLAVKLWQRMCTDSIVSFFKEIYFNLTFPHQEKICAEIKWTVFELNCMSTGGFVLVLSYVYTDFQLHILPELTAVTISVHNIGKALVSPAIIWACPVGFVAFNLSAFL